MFTREQLNALYRYCISLAGDETQAYDLLQASIEKFLMADASKVDNRNAYIKRVIRNQHIDNCRKYSKNQHEEYDDSVTYLDTDVNSLDGIIATEYQVEAVWSKLSSSEREIMYFWAIEGYSTSELAELLGVSRGTLLSKIHRLKKRLEYQLFDSSEEGII